MQNKIIGILMMLPRLVDSALQCCFRISALRPWLLAFGCTAVHVGFFIILKAGERPPSAS